MTIRRYNMKKLTNNGYTMIEMLMSLLVFTLSMSLLVSMLPIIPRIQQFHFSIEEETALYQIRTLLSLSSEIKFNEYNLEFFYLGEQASLIIDNDKIVRKHGTVIYLDQLIHPIFKKKDNCIYVNYERNKKKKERFIGCE